MTLYTLAARGANLLSLAGIENAAQESVFILSSLSGLSTTQYLLRRDEEASQSVATEYLRLIDRRAKRVPLQYLLGQTEFFGMPFAVGDGVLIPRPETEELVQLCKDRIRERGYRSVYDLCSGSGCIGISIAVHCPQTEVWLFEKYEAALTYIRRNIPSDITDRVHVIEADIFTFDPSSLPQPDLIVSNPPYIASAEIDGLQEEVRCEPFTALDGGADGLDFYRCIAERWTHEIKKGGFLAVECGETQTEDVMALLTAAETKNTRKDMFGLFRFVTAEF